MAHAIYAQPAARKSTLRGVTHERKRPPLRLLHSQRVKRSTQHPAQPLLNKQWMLVCLAETLNPNVPAAAQVARQEASNQYQVPSGLVCTKL